MYYAIFLVQVIVFYLTSKKVAGTLYALLNNMFDKYNTLKIYSFIFLPGTMLHELSHYLSAKLLFVPVGRFNLKARYEDDGSIQMGSVSIAKTDPIRRFLIGIAPIIIGVLFLLFFSFLIRYVDMIWTKALLMLLIFTTANSMFSSRKDMEGAFKLFFSIGLFIVVIYFLGIEVRIRPPVEFVTWVNDLIKITVEWLMLPLIINIALLITVSVLKKI